MHNRILRILGIALTLALLISLIPAIPAMASGVLDTPNPASGSPGTRVYLTGTGFTAGNSIRIYFNTTGSTSGTSISGGTVPSSGNISTSFYVPTNTPKGTYLITLYTTDDGASNSQGFEVTPKIALSDTSGYVGDEITVTGNGFTANRNVTIQFDGVTQITTTATSYGTINPSLTIPKHVRGSYYVTAIDYYGQSVTAYFTISSKLTISPTTAAAGDLLTIAGTGFGGSQSVTIYFDGTSVTSSTTDSQGSFTISNYALPKTYTGTHTIRAQDSSSYQSATVTVEQAFSLSSNTGTVGTNITISGTGFKASSSIALTIDNTVISSASISSDAYGSFSGTFSIPPISAGAHQIKVSDGTTTDTKDFTVIPIATANPSSGVIGAKITVNGSGFFSNQAISILFDNSSVKTTTTDAQGSFGTSFEAPSLPAGTYKIRATDGANYVDMNFTITTSVSITQTTATNPAYVGAQIMVGGVGFKAGATVSISIDGKEVKTGVVGSDSNFSIQFSVPAIKSGQHTVTVTDGTTTLPLDLFMEGTPPATPALILPDAGVRTNATPTLTWNPVSDPSGVTYTLQISSDTNFSTLIMEKPGLTISQYTLTKDEKLKPVSRDNAYYWRVKATDGAFNESGWSNARSFIVGSAFPTWALWTLIGLGAVIILLFVYWIGRRTASTRPPSTRLEDN